MKSAVLCMQYVGFTSRDSAVGIVTSYWLDDRGIEVQTGSEVHPTPNPLSDGYRGLFPRG
jgi:hypothetical protein